ncbi:hypothetical protein ACFO25_00210 [Paenactinomyces guangxiensis]
MRFECWNCGSDDIVKTDSGEYICRDCDTIQ